MMMACITFTQEGFHAWPQAAGKRIYLASRHRHLFHVEVQLEVFHDEREVEYHDLLDFCKACFAGGEMNGQSCETMARTLAEYVAMQYPGRYLTTSILEDGEVGAVYHREVLTKDHMGLS